MEMKTITMNANGFTETLPAIITSALWYGWEGNGDEYSRRVDELRSTNQMFETLQIPVRIDFSYEVNVDDGEHQPYTPYAVRIGVDANGKGGHEIEVFHAAQELWYKTHPEDRPAPPRKLTPEETAEVEKHFRNFFRDANE